MRQGYVICQWHVEGIKEEVRVDSYTVQVLDREQQQPSLEVGPGIGEGDDLFWIFVVYCPEVKSYRDT